jgi:hypothetical protein
MENFPPDREYIDLSQTDFPGSWPVPPTFSQNDSIRTVKLNIGGFGYDVYQQKEHFSKALGLLPRGTITVVLVHSNMSDESLRCQWIRTFFAALFEDVQIQVLKIELSFFNMIYQDLVFMKFPYLKRLVVFVEDETSTETIEFSARPIHVLPNTTLPRITGYFEQNGPFHDLTAICLRNVALKEMKSGNAAIVSVILQKIASHPSDIAITCIQQIVQCLRAES